MPDYQVSTTVRTTVTTYAVVVTAVLSCTVPTVLIKAYKKTQVRKTVKTRKNLTDMLFTTLFLTSFQKYWSEIHGRDFHVIYSVFLRPTINFVLNIIYHTD